MKVTDRIVDLAAFSMSYFLTLIVTYQAYPRYLIWKPHIT